MKNTRAFVAFLLAGWMAASLPAAGMADSHEEVSNPDLKCLKCHSKNLKKKLEDGTVMPLKVDVEAFSTSVHTVIGCTGCHRDVAKGKHPSREPIESARAYSLKHNQACSQCHTAHFDEYKGSIHARLAADGDENAPLCSDCHSAHAIQHRAVYKPESGEPCSRCHQEVFEAYATSVHGLAYEFGNTIRGEYIQSPMCFDCHQPHNVRAVASDDQLISRCTSCHEVSRLAHEQWLPNAKRHLTTVSCPVCHSSGAERVINLQMVEKADGSPVVTAMDEEAVQDVLAQIDPEGNGLDSFELWKLMRLANESEATENVILQGSMEVRDHVEAHRLAPRAEALRDCENCHVGDSVAFQNVTVSVNMSDGRRRSVSADQAVLSSAISFNSLGGFYAPGGTRIKIIDWLLLMAVVGGLAIPLGHMTLGRYLRKNGLSKDAPEKQDGAQG
ncbi:MAG: hypothetical protein HKP02_11505 [Xanthomonadales bacterium]|nr:hypothetical protein [Xanthomonadales bacterium]